MLDFDGSNLEAEQNGTGAVELIPAGVDHSQGGYRAIE